MFRAAAEAIGIGRDGPWPWDKLGTTDIADFAHNVSAVLTAPRSLDFPAVVKMLGDAGHASAPLSHGLNRVLANVGMRPRFDGGMWVAEYTPGTLWTALHVELGTQLAFRGFVPDRCAECGAAYWRRTSGRRHSHQRFAPNHNTCRMRLSRAEKAGRTEPGR